MVKDRECNLSKLLILSFHFILFLEQTLICCRHTFDDTGQIEFLNGQSKICHKEQSQNLNSPTNIYQHPSILLKYGTKSNRYL